MTSGGRIDIVEQLRGAAALAVAWFHLTNGYDDWVALSGAYGWLGVEVFFVISGFVIPLSLARNWEIQGVRALPLFLLRRIVRIEPPYLMSALLVVVLNLMAMHIPGFKGGIQTYSVPQVLLHVAYLIPLTHYDWLQPVYWTLAYEFVFYLVVAAVIGLLASPVRWPVLAGFAALLAAVSGNIASPLLALFAMGCLVFRARTGRDPTWVAAAVIVLAGLAMARSGSSAEALAGMIVAALLLSPRLASGATGLLGQLLRALGTISFSLYLIHIPIGGKIVNLGQRWMSGPVSHLFLSLLALTASLAAAGLLWRFVERPCIAASKKLAKLNLGSLPSSKLGVR